MAIGNAASGFLLLDSSLNPLAYNPEAIDILSFPTKPDRIRQMQVFLADKIRSSLVHRQSQDGLDFVKAFRSGQRRYLCRAFRLACNGNGTGPVPSIAVLLERPTSGAEALTQLSEQFDLTHRERETVELLLQGLTSKEIANRMQISPNTVKAFLRLVMVKMDVSTRSGIVGRIVGHKS